MMDLIRYVVLIEYIGQDALFFIIIDIYVHVHGEVYKHMELFVGVVIVLGGGSACFLFINNFEMVKSKQCPHLIYDSYFLTSRKVCRTLSETPRDQPSYDHHYHHHHHHHYYQ